jgi:hypothetical protein
MNFLPGWFPAGALGAYSPKSYDFNGTDEYLSRTWATSSPNRRTFTLSFWVKCDALATAGFVQGMLTSRVDANNYLRVTEAEDTGYVQVVDRAASVNNAVENSPTGSLVIGAWRHVVVRVDTPLTTDFESRVRVYINNAEPYTEITTPALNYETAQFVNNAIQYIGTLDGAPNGPFNGKLAFIDVVEGLSLPPAAFAHSVGGVWTRRPYVGSYGNYGFALDGSRGFQDVSGNGQHFAPTNMGASNLLDDMPPYTTVRRTSPTSLTQISTATSSAASVTLPSGIQAGDLLIMSDTAVNNVSGGAPTNWTEITAAVSGTTFQHRAYYRIADGTESSTSVTGMTGTTFTRKAVVTFRGDVPINAITPNSAGAQHTTGNPSGESTFASSGAVPLIAFGMYGSTSSISPRDFTPAEDGELASGTENYIKWKIYAASPADVAVNSEDEGANNTLLRFYLQAR